MKRIILTAIIILTSVQFTTFAETSPEILLSAHQGAGNAVPVQSNYYTDNVIWTYVANSGRSFGRASGGVIGLNYFCFGSIYEPLAQVFNWTTEHWQLGTPPPLGNCNWCAVTADSVIYLIGRYFDYQFGNEMQKFSPDPGQVTGQWSLLAPYPIAGAGIAAAWDYGQYIYACGGSDLAEVFDTAYRYNINNDSWEEIASLPVPMTYHGGHFLNGNFHVVGGIEEDGLSHYAYDPASDTWTQKASLSIPNYFALFSLTGNFNFIFSIGGGGGYEPWPATDAVQIYDPLSDSWAMDNPLPEVFGLNTAASMPNGNIISSGGYTEYYYVQTTYRGEGFPLASGVVDVEDDASTIPPEKFAVSPAFPNPFNSIMTVAYTLHSPSEVTAEIYNLKGNILFSNNEFRAPGSHTMSIDLDKASSGIYFLRISADNLKHSQKILYLP